MARSPMLGARLRRLRKDRGLTQVKLAEILGISPSYLNMIEHNDRPLTVSLLLKLSDVLGVDLRDFSAGDEVRIKSDLEEALSRLFKEIFAGCGLDFISTRQHRGLDDTGV